MTKFTIKRCIQRSKAKKNVKS